jgi:hypothetical protein
VELNWNYEAYTCQEAMKTSYPDIEPIPDAPENIARAIMRRPPKAEWDFEKDCKLEPPQLVDSTGDG